MQSQKQQSAPRFAPLAQKPKAAKLDALPTRIVETQNNEYRRETN
jgi:hypothetical protein